MRAEDKFTEDLAPCPDCRGRGYEEDYLIPGRAVRFGCPSCHGTGIHHPPSEEADDEELDVDDLPF